MKTSYNHRTYTHLIPNECRVIFRRDSVLARRCRLWIETAAEWARIIGSAAGFPRHSELARWKPQSSPEIFYDLLMYISEPSRFLFCVPVSSSYPRVAGQDFIDCGRVMDLCNRNDLF
jgi:hypothetical protein